MTEDEFQTVFEQGYEEGLADGFWYGSIGGIVLTSIIGIVLWMTW